MKTLEDLCEEIGLWVFPCACHDSRHGLVVSRNDEGGFYLEVIQDGLSIVDRLRVAWRVLRDGGYQSGSVVEVLAENVPALIDLLQRAARMSSDGADDGQPFDEWLAQWKADEPGVVMDAGDIAAEIAAYEQKYGMTSAEFMATHDARARHDNMEFQDWASLLGHSSNVQNPHIVEDGQMARAEMIDAILEYESRYGLSTFEMLKQVDEIGDILYLKPKNPDEQKIWNMLYHLDFVTWRIWARFVLNT